MFNLMSSIPRGLGGGGKGEEEVLKENKVKLGGLLEGGERGGACCLYIPFFSRVRCLGRMML